ncbi:S9 family peptidase [Gloeobacter violaceus]|uniref:Acylamino-acid-releasing enzyme n=1 Tax=Gloeobacter violaceus (strain ATCC 29082 / PCC 7421) TaxID=251221 RepID=Q7NN33_GLOVI|nr:S9 family peptidase [Gloeobacter violaceus]BAC88522.1 acylamino-acid-releasing enzyme [Gloeobacter violaceus PCC 7421]
MKHLRGLSLLCAAVSGFAAAGTLLAVPAMAELPPLIPREVLFGNPERTSPRLSPDGKRLAWLAPDKNNVLQVWVKTIGQNDDKVVTADKKRGIRFFTWAYNNRTLIYQQDLDGDENFHLYGVDLPTAQVRDFTPFKGVRAGIAAIDPAYPDGVLVSLNKRNPQLFDIYRLDLKTGELKLDTENPGDVLGWGADAKLAVRAAQVKNADGSNEIRIRDSAKAPWKSRLKAGPTEILEFVDFTADGESAVLRSSLGSDTVRVVLKGINKKNDKVLAADARVDAESVLIQPRTRLVQAVSFAPGRTEWKVVSPSVEADFAALEKVFDGDFTVVNRSADDSTWLVAYTSDRGSVRYYTWNRRTQKAALLLVQQPKLEGLPLAKMEPVTITARDGLKLNAYLTTPVGVPARKLPMVLFVHGGPWSRDDWGYDPYAQWFANRGYAVLQVNFRGSTGYGKNFLNAGNRQWGLKMHEDLIDAVNWAAGTLGLADPKKVAIYGGSYGGYAALAGLAFTPEVFACGVDIVGPSNIKTLINSIPPYWKPFRSEFDLRVGNIDDPKDAELIKNASPLFKADRIRKPLLIGQGANDPRVKQAESEQIVEAIEKNGGQVTYVVYPDEGHGFARPENRIDFNARAEKFLADCLGGRSEPMPSDPIAGATAVVKQIGPKASSAAP